MASFVDEYLADFRSSFPFVIWGVTSVLLAVSGPFGAYEAVWLGDRLAFWFLAVALGGLVGMAVRAFVRAVLGWRQFPGSVIVIAVLNTLILTPPANFLASALSGGRVPHQPSVWEVAMFILSCSTASGVLRRWAEVSVGPEMMVADDFAAVSNPEPRLLSRLDAELRAPLVAISVRDHYVDVVTRAGRQSLLMRLTDAIAETDSCEGARIHRSHWVARDAALALERTGADRWSVVLVDGSRLPLARGQRQAIADWGLEVQRPTEAMGAGKARGPVNTASAEG